MEENVSRELEAIRGMLLNWKNSYVECASAPGESDYLALEFLEEIQTHVYPYARRLRECQYLTESEAEEFLAFCYQQVTDLRELLLKQDMSL